MLCGYSLQFSTNALIGAGRILLLNNIYFSTTVCRPMPSAVSCSRLAGTLLIECGMAREPGTERGREEDLRDGPRFPPPEGGHISLLIGCVNARINADNDIGIETNLGMKRNPPRLYLPFARVITQGGAWTN